MLVILTNSLLTQGHGKFYFASLYSVFRKPHISVVSHKGRAREPVVVETYKIRVNALVGNKGLEPLRRSTRS